MLMFKLAIVLNEKLKTISCEETNASALATLDDCDEPCLIG